jgi:hypothetical protein
MATASAVGTKISGGCRYHEYLVGLENAFRKQKKPRNRRPASSDEALSRPMPLAECSAKQDDPERQSASIA